MDAKMSTTKIGCYNKVFESAFSREETAEAVVPDVFPDISGIADATGIVCLRGKEARSGEMSLSAVVNSTILYRPEGERHVKKLEVSVPFSINCDAPAVNENSDLVCRLRLCSIDVRALNPRKVLVRAELAVELEAYSNGEIELCGAPEDLEGHRVNLKEAEQSFMAIVSVKEKTFVLNEDHILPGTLPAMREIISKRAELNCEEIKPVGNKLVFRGAATVSLLYNPAGEDESTVQAASFSTEFSQIIEMDVPMDQVSARVSPMLTGIYVEQSGSDGRKVSAELHVVAQVVGAEALDIRYIEDAYCNEHPVALTRDSLSLIRHERDINLRETLREVIETAAKVREVIDVSTMPGRVYAEGNTMKCDLRIRVLFRDIDAELRSQTAKFTVSAAAEIGDEMSLRDCTAFCGESFATVSSGGIELRIPVDFSARLEREIQISPISALSLDDETSIDVYARPSITVLRADKKHSVWSLAKKYCSTPELVMSANELSSDNSISGRLLLIPRSR